MTNASKTTKLGDQELVKVIDGRQQLIAQRAKATAELRQQMIELQAQIAKAEKPYTAKIEMLENIAKEAILERGGVAGLVTDVKIMYRNGYEKRHVDLDGLYGLAKVAPKVWNVVKKHVEMIWVEPSVRFED